MHTFFKTACVALALGVAGCAAGPKLKVVTPLEQATLSAKTFAWKDGLLAKDVPGGFDGRNVRALDRAIVKALTAKGYVQTKNPDEADLLVAVHFGGAGSMNAADTVTEMKDSGPSDWELEQLDEAQDYYAHTNRPIPAPPRKETARAYSWYQREAVADIFIDGVLAIRVLEAGSEDSLWLGTIQNEISMSTVNEFDRRIGENVARLMKDFPASQ